MVGNSINKAINLLTDNLDIIFTYLIVVSVLLATMFYILPATAKAGMYIGIEIGERLENKSYCLDTPIDQRDKKCNQGEL